MPGKLRRLPPALLQPKGCLSLRPENKPAAARDRVPRMGTVRAANPAPPNAIAAAQRFRPRPCRCNEAKKPGPIWSPIVKTKGIRPNSRAKFQNSVLDRPAKMAKKQPGKKHSTASPANAANLVQCLQPAHYSCSWLKPSFPLWLGSNFLKEHFFIIGGSRARSRAKRYQGSSIESRISERIRKIVSTFHITRKGQPYG
jgi:hypothetical protein